MFSIRIFWTVLGLRLKTAEAILEAIASQDTSDLDLSEDEEDTTVLQTPLPDASSSGGLRYTSL